MFKQIEVASICSFGHFLSSAPSESSSLFFFCLDLLFLVSFCQYWRRSDVLSAEALGLTAHVGRHAHIFFFIIHFWSWGLSLFGTRRKWQGSFEKKEDASLQVLWHLRKAVWLSMNTVFESGSSVPAVYKQNVNVEYLCISWWSWWVFRSLFNVLGQKKKVPSGVLVECSTEMQRTALKMSGQNSVVDSKLVLAKGWNVI